MNILDIRYLRELATTFKVFGETEQSKFVDGLIDEIESLRAQQPPGTAAVDVWRDEDEIEKCFTDDECEICESCEGVEVGVSESCTDCCGTGYAQPSTEKCLRIRRPAMTRDEFENTAAVVCVNIETSDENQVRAYRMFLHHDAEQRARIKELETRLAELKGKLAQANHNIVCLEATCDIAAGSLIQRCEESD